MTCGNFASRLRAAFLAGFAGLGAALTVPHLTKIEGSGLVLLGGVLLLASAFAGYNEPVAKRVWVHVVVLVIPMLIALGYGVTTCKGHGCASFAVAAILGSFFALLVLSAVSFAAFFVRRRFRSHS